MRYLKYLALLAVLTVPMAYSQAQVSVGVGIGVGPAYVAGPPVCAYGYYNYYPYACAPYGYYGPQYFVDGVFVGVGPWYHWGHPAWFWNRGSYGWRHEAREHGYGRGWGYGHDRYARGYTREGYGRGYVRGSYGHEGGCRGGYGFHCTHGFHGGGHRKTCRSAIPNGR